MAEIERSTALHDLSASPIYAMSLGSKELFHSNFWFWLIDKDPMFANVFFPEIDPSLIRRVERESKYRDLLIEMKDGSSYVIENKIKSIPSNEQLEKYQEKTGSGSFKQGLLTGILPTLDLKNNQSWRFESYRKIALKIKEMAHLSDDETIRKHRRLIVEYSNMVLSLSKVVEKQLEMTKGYLDYSVGHLDEIRLGDTYKKIKSEDFVQRYLRESEELHALVPEGYKILIETSFSNKSAIIDVRFNIKDDKCIGIQIQGNQFRIIAERRIANICDSVFEEFSSHHWFDPDFDFHSNRAVFGNQTTMRPRNRNKKYNSYQTASYSFVYQFFNLDENTSEYGTLYSRILEYMRKAKDIALIVNR